LPCFHLTRLSSLQTLSSSVTLSLLCRLQANQVMPYVFQIGDQRSGPATYFETLLRCQRYGRLSYLLCIRHSFHYHYATSRIGRPRDTLPKASTNMREVRTHCLSSFKMLSRQHETDSTCLVSALSLKYRSPVPTVGLRSKLPHIAQ
jgi:hypothetical protein